MKKLLIIFLLLVTHYSLVIGYAQPVTPCLTGRQAGQYLPQYNLWLPGSQMYQQSMNFHYHNQVYNIDSLFYWQYVQTLSDFPIDIFFIDSLYGWAAHTGGGVLRTTNSGFNWDTVQLVSGGPVVGVHFVDRNTGWAVGIESLIRKTTNGGINWIVQDTPTIGTAAFYNSVHFFNSDTGIIIGNKGVNPSPGYIVRTTNGGNNWRNAYLIYDTIHYDNTLNRQFWFNNNTGWMCGDNILLKTTDGGLTYTNYYSHVPQTQNGYNGFLDLYFVNEDTGWLCGSNLDHKNIYKTTNAGLNWVFQDNPVANYEYPQIDGIIFINSDTGWASSYVGLIIVTTNGGTNWVVNQVVNNWTSVFAKYNSSKVWLGGDHGKIWYTLPQIPIGIINNNWNIPREFKMEQNYPNPFNPSTKIRFSLPHPSKGGEQEVKLAIYDILGREVAVLVNEQLKPGSYEVEWDGSNFSSGIYFYKLMAGNFAETKKLILLK